MGRAIATIFTLIFFESQAAFPKPVESMPDLQ
jgi:hypothetical protein